jgi:competence protein ComFC
MIPILNTLITYLFPVTCVLCKKDLPENDYYRICKECQGGIKLIDGLICRKCGIPLPDGGQHCCSCLKSKNQHFNFIRSVSIYDGAIKDLIFKYKYFRQDYLSRYFSKLLYDLILPDKCLNSADCITAVPLHWFKKLKRGYNQSELLACSLAKLTGKTHLKNVLIRKKYTEAQVKLNKENRIKNTEGCFAVISKEEVKGKKILLIDDVCTTTATLNECSRVLVKSGAQAIYGLTIARD